MNMSQGRVGVGVRSHLAGVAVQSQSPGHLGSRILGQLPNCKKALLARGIEVGIRQKQK